MLVTVVEIFYKIGDFIANYSYYVILIMVAILLFVSFFIGLHKQKQSKKMIKEELEKNKIIAPESQKRYEPGSELKVQEWENKKEDK